MIERINPAQRWSDAVVVNGIVFLAGHVAEDTRGQSVAEQTADILAQLEDTLAQSGSSKDRLVSVNIYLSDIAGFDEMNAVWDKWVDTANPPARTTVEARLAHPDLFVEMTAVAAR